MREKSAYRPHGVKMALSLMIVDDSFIARNMLKQRLPKGEYRIREADSGAKAIELFKQEEPHVVLLDLTMPVMTGFDVLVELKKINPDVKVVIISADVQEKARERVLSAGALNMLTKPPQPSQLQEIFDQIAT
jgi:two-component system chemotaxis response regulator CheY